MGDKEYRKGVITGVVVTLLLGTSGFLGYQLGGIGDEKVLSNREYVTKLEYLESLIDEEYLNECSDEDLAEGLYAGLIYGLDDAYSRYYTAEEYEAENSATEGSYVGIGVAMQQNRDGSIEIVECYEGGPGELAGLESGDLISAVDGVDITELTLSDVVGMIKGSDAESVVLTIHREDVEDALEIQVPIQDVELPSVFSEMLDDQVGYLRISEFKGVTAEQYKTAYASLQDQGMKKLVVDLRDNPGGLLDSVCDILNEILPEGLIVYTEDKYGEREEFFADGEHILDVPLAVLVNESSASASEIFAGAVQDYGIGTIVGTATYGKGVVQAIHALGDGSAVKLTVSKYYTPNGNSIHEIGIQPDVEVKLDTKLLNKEEISHEEDNQLQAALNVLAGQNAE